MIVIPQSPRVLSIWVVVVLVLAHVGSVVGPSVEGCS